MIAEIEKLEEERETAKQAINPNNQDNKQVFRMFPPGKCRILVLRYKQLYKLSTEKKAQPFYLYHIVLDGYTAAYWFHEVCYALDLENEPVALTGRIMSLRGAGAKLIFIDLHEDGKKV